MVLVLPSKNLLGGYLVALILLMLAHGHPNAALKCPMLLDYLGPAPSCNVLDLAVPSFEVDSVAHLEHLIH